MLRRKLFCEYGPVCYYLSVWKENRRKEIMDLLSRKNFAKNKLQCPAILRDQGALFFAPQEIRGSRSCIAGF